MPIAFEQPRAASGGAGGGEDQREGLGRVFIYKKDRTSNPAHSAVAKITAGIDMIKLAGPGQLITVNVKPDRIMLLGSKLDDAIAQMQKRGIDVEVKGHTGEDAVVVGQDPAQTMSILKNKKVLITSIPSSRLVAVELDDSLAPKTLDYFRHVTGLKERPVGPLPVFFVYEDTLLFKPEIDATSLKNSCPRTRPQGRCLPAR